MTEVRLEHLTKRDTEVVAVDDVNLTIRSGEFVVVVGPSGCGKTTLLRMIAGLLDPDEGDVYLDGERVTDVSAGRRGVQMIFQSYALWPHMRVLDASGYSNLSYPLHVQGMSFQAIREKLAWVTRKVGLESRLFRRRPTELSAGEKQRVALARSLTTSPKVFLMDEPLTNLDPPSRVQVRDEIYSLNRELHTTTVYVTHNMVDAYAMADRLVMMRDGRLVQVGTVEDVRAHPVDEFVAGFLNSPG